MDIYSDSYGHFPARIGRRYVASLLIFRQNLCSPGHPSYDSCASKLHFPGSLDHFTAQPLQPRPESFSPFA